MSTFIWNICLWRWTRPDSVFRIRIGWVKKGVDYWPGGEWRRIVGRLWVTAFYTPNYDTIRKQTEQRIEEIRRG